MGISDKINTEEIKRKKYSPQFKDQVLERIAKDGVLSRRGMKIKKSILDGIFKRRLLASLDIYVEVGRTD
jgi:hypothetical protein